MPLCLPYAFQDREPMVLQFGPPIRGPLPPKASDYDPWFDASQKEIKDAKEREQPTQSSAERPLCPHEILPEHLFPGRQVWVWLRCAFRDDPLIRKQIRIADGVISTWYEYPYQVTVITIDEASKRCGVLHKTGDYESVSTVEWSSVQLSEPRIGGFKSKILKKFVSDVKESPAKEEDEDEDEKLKGKKMAKPKKKVWVKVTEKKAPEKTSECRICGNDPEECTC